MQMIPATAEWARHWLYDWGGANVSVLLSVNRNLAPQWRWAAQLVSALGSYWGAPAMLALLWLFSRRPSVDLDAPARLAPWTFLVAFALAFALAAVLKPALAFPRPAVALGPGVIRALGAPDSQYSLPSGHATYAAVVAGTLWPLVRRPLRLLLVLAAIAVGWSRVALGAHFPADVLWGWALGAASAAMAAPVVRRFHRWPGDTERTP
ncbi:MULTISPECIES: phosphatase PAP2 family protein [Ramlibacter]|uniref:Phosphatase PAP2 family protein n=1 Tax=Ramlibacter aquaticus TaxID=2780094 RepID=A0ABR9SEH7_9BURK|nr:MULTISPECIES: phosphatase PAP2 family protein [Ramlibacter]MBE7940728.1 phosphatase PAP2 family protein [Ramlibacter aquaticus]